MKNHTHFELCRRAHQNTSFDPERRAVGYCKEIDSLLAKFSELGASQKAQTKLEKLFIEWMWAKSRCVSSMIVGPAGLQTDRAKKAYDSEMKKGQAFYDYFERVQEAIEKERFYKEHPEERPISNNDEDALECLKKKLEKLKQRQEMMKKANVLFRKKDFESLIALTGEKAGFARFTLSNNLANIKRVEERIKKIEQFKSIPNKTINLGNQVTVTQNTEEMRVFFEFPGKPNDEIRKLLKTHCFRWTPSRKHWGRKLTGNANYAARVILKKLKEEN